MLNPTISVAMCTYNGSRYLTAQLSSLLRQLRPPDEVVICDDGSTDNTAALLLEFSQTAPFPVKLFRNERNLGYSRNFAQAISCCTGDIVALSDQDDIWYPQKLRRIVELFAADPRVGGVFSDGDLIGTDSQPLPGSLWGSFNFQRRDLPRMHGEVAVRVLLRRNVVTGMAFAFRREWSRGLQQMPEHWPHDFWLAFMIAAKGVLKPCPERLVAYRVHAAQQIGVPITRADKVRYLREHGPGAYLALSRERNLREYTKDAAQFESLLHAVEGYDYAAPALGGSSPTLAEDWWVPLARNKARHMRRGVVQLRQGRLRRLASALYHWRSYRDYAPTGLAALLRDLML